ncbi:unnamed protein product [Clonostachys rosea f. rosea IK726]|uniref:Uncharacterized protein n=1 Tax=Clonostachys rosea f. rosea IK726 TaxID=1349383 RepID=A0ACA9U7R8_BIOOC|nr:unnamed protein product [Clonostachys rosea f. rosea IK726]
MSTRLPGIEIQRTTFVRMKTLRCQIPAPLMPTDFTKAHSFDYYNYHITFSFSFKMVAIHNLGLAAFVWLGLASKGLAMGIDESTDGLYLVERDEPVELEARTRRGRPGDDPRTWGPNAGGHGPRQGGKGTRSIDDFETELFTRTRRGGRPGDDPRTWGPNAGGHAPRQGRRGLETDLFTRTRRGGRPGDDPRTWGPNAGGHGPRHGGKTTRDYDAGLFTRTRKGGRPGDDPRTWGPNAGGHGPRQGGRGTRSIDDYEGELYTRARNNPGYHPAPVRGGSQPRTGGHRGTRDLEELEE